MNNLQEFLNIIRTSIDKFDSIIKLLKKLKTELKENHDDKLQVKTAGTALGAVGTVATVTAVALTPFTGGLSLFVAGSLGVAASVAGGATNIIADYAYSKFQKEELEKLKGYVAQLEKIGHNLDAKLGIYESCLKLLLEENYDPDTAFNIIVNSLKENLLSLVQSEQLFSFASLQKNSHQVRLTNSKQVFNDISQWKGMMIKDVLRKKIVFDLDRSNCTLIAEPGIEEFFEINLTAVTGIVGGLKIYDTLEKVVAATMVGGKLGATSSVQILKTVEISAKEAASFAGAGASATTTALKTGTNTLSKVLSVATVGLSVVLTIYEIGSLIQQFGEKEILIDEVDKVLNFCNQKLVALRALKCSIKKQTDDNDDDDDCKCKNIKLKVLYFNARSINSDYGYSQEKMRKMRELVFLHVPNIVAVCETWLNHMKEDNQIENLLSLAGYAIYRQDRNADNDFSVLEPPSRADKRGGGLMVAFRAIESSFAFSRFSHLDYRDNLMHFLGSYKYLCNRCSRKTKKNDFKFGFILGYRPPRLPRSEDQELVNLMKDNCAKIMNGHDGFAMVADFNCGNKSISTLGFSEYHATNFPATHINGNGLDQVIYYGKEFVTDARVVDRVSDHNAIIFNLNFGKDFTNINRCEAKRCT